MKPISFDNVMDLIQNKTGFVEFAGELLRDELYKVICYEYLNQGNDVDLLAEQCVQAYEKLFSLNLRMNRYTDIYENRLINEIISVAFSRFATPIYGGRNGQKCSGIQWVDIDEFKEKVIKSFDEKNGKSFKIDCHVHTSDLSDCAYHDAHKLIDRAIKIGLNGIVITEHDKLTPPSRIQELNEAYAPFKVFSGVEIRIDDDDFLVLGIHDEILEQDWEYVDLYNFVRERDGYIALAHPLRYSNGVDSNILSLRPDALEMYSNNMNKYELQSKQNVLSLSNALGTKLIANSDAHAQNDFGFCNVIDRTPENEAELIQMLKNGEYRLGRVNNYHE